MVFHILNMKQELLSNIFDEKIVIILSELLKKRGRFYLRDLSRETGVSLATTYRIIQKLKNSNIVYKDGREKIEFYEINRTSDEFKILKKIFFDNDLENYSKIKEKLKNKFENKFKIYTDKKDKNKIIIVSSSIPDEFFLDIKKEYTDSNILYFSSSKFLELQNADFINLENLTEV